MMILRFKFAGKKVLITTFLGFITLLLISVPGAHGDPSIRFHITDLGVLRGALESAAVAINNNGQISGMLGYPEAIQVFRLDQHQMTTFPNWPGHNISYVADMNDEGTIAGTAGQNPDIRFPFIVHGDRLENLAPLFPGMPAYFRGINNRGEIVGTYTRDPYRSDWTAFIYSNGVVKPLTFGPRDFSAANAINDFGVAVGFSAGRAAVFSGDDVIPLDFASSAEAINNRGSIVGVMGARPFLYRDGVVTDIGLLPGDESAGPTAINNFDMVVGTSRISWDETRPFVYQDGALYDLNDLIQPRGHWVLSVANDINDRGEIVGYGMHKGVMRAFRLTPMHGSVPRD
jgi:probable HAF family extracellular repeat protein